MKDLIEFTMSSPFYSELSSRHIMTVFIDNRIKWATMILIYNYKLDFHKKISPANR